MKKAPAGAAKKVPPSIEPAATTVLGPVTYADAPTYHGCRCDRCRHWGACMLQLGTIMDASDWCHRPALGFTEAIK